MPSRALRTFAWGAVAYTLAVIVWGAFVRATMSGDGCGDHWPLCNGELVPPAPTHKTMIELAHRVTSGLAMLVAVGLFAWTRRLDRAHPGRRAATYALVFMVTEALVGAAIVLLKKVAHDASWGRAVWMSAHLVNTFLLLGAMVLTAYFLSGGRPIRLRGQGIVGRAVFLALGLFMLLGVTGAIAALGDTLFPAESLARGLEADTAAGSPLLLKLRLLHPTVAMTLGVVLVGALAVITALRPSPSVQRAAAALGVLFVVQIALGFTNVALLAPVWLQLVHLLNADLVWMALVLLSATALGAEAAQPGLADSGVTNASAL